MGSSTRARSRRLTSGLVNKRRQRAQVGVATLGQGQQAACRMSCSRGPQFLVEAVEDGQHLVGDQFRAATAS